MNLFMNKILWQGEYNGGLLILFVARPKLDKLYWKVFDPGLENPVQGSVELQLNADIPLSTVIDMTLDLIDSSVLSLHQRIKDECICAGARIN